METNHRSKRVNITDLWTILVQRLPIMILVAALVLTGVRIFESYLKVPMYESTATLYILRRDNELDYTYTQSDFKLALDVVNDCTYVLKSAEVLQEVVEELDIDYSINLLSHRIRTNNPENTRFLEISIVDETPKKAKSIVNCLCDKGSVKIEESMGFDQVTIYSYGHIPAHPSNMLGPFSYLLLALIVMMIVFSIFFILFLLDDKIKTPDDIIEHLGISSLAEIPNSDIKNLRKNSKYRYNKYSS